MVKSDGTALGAAENLYPTIGILHTMIKHCSAHLNGTFLYPQSDTYPYRWYINTLLNYTLGRSGTILRSEGWFPRDPTTGFTPIDVAVTLTANKLDTVHANFIALPDTQKASVRAMQTERAL